MRLVVLVATLGLLAGCMECGPQVGSVEASADLPASLYPTQPQVRDALARAGFTAIDDVPGTLTMERDEQRVSFHAEGNMTSYWLIVQVADKEFKDSPGGSQDARDYIARESAAHQTEADATFDLVREAMGIPDHPSPALGGTYSIC